MSNKNLDASAGLDNLKSIIEKAADSKFLLLLITFLLYLDIWLLNYGINPYKLTLLNTYEAIKNLSVFTVIIFTLSYSLLMSCFFQ